MPLLATSKGGQTRVEAPGSRAEDFVHGRYQARLGAPVFAEREAVGGMVGGFEVGEDVRSAEAVDSLLWVADQEKEGSAT